MERWTELTKEVIEEREKKVINERERKCIKREREAKMK